MMTEPEVHIDVYFFLQIKLQEATDVWTQTKQRVPEKFILRKKNVHMNKTPWKHLQNTFTFGGFLSLYFRTFSKAF